MTVNSSRCSCLSTMMLPLVSVFDLEEIADHRIDCHTSDQVSSSLRWEGEGSILDQHCNFLVMNMKMEHLFHAFIANVVYNVCILHWYMMVNVIVRKWDVAMETDTLRFHCTMF